MLRKLNILGLKIDATPEDVKKLAADLSVLQANVYRQTSIEHYLDQDAGEGHANFELNKFGVALQQAIKVDLRANPQKCYLDFYATLMSVLYQMRNYELAARVYNGINDALMRDHCDVAPGQYELPVEDKKIAKKRELLRKNFEAIECYEYFLAIKFPSRDQARDLYQTYLNTGETFVPMVETLFKFISMYLEGNSLSASDKKHIETDKEKAERLKSVANDVVAELKNINTILGEHLPLDFGYLNFEKLKTLFGGSLILNLEKNPDQINNKLCKVLGIKDEMDVIGAPVVAPHKREVKLSSISPRGMIKYPRSPRKSVKSGVFFGTPRSNSDAASGSLRTSGLFSSRKLRSNSVVERRASLTEISYSSSEELSPRNE